MELIIERKLYEDYEFLVKKGFYEPNDVHTTLKFIKISIEQHVDLEEFLEIELTIQIVISDYDKSYWFSVKNNRIECGEGIIDNPTGTLEGPVEDIVLLLLSEQFQYEKVKNFHSKFISMFYEFYGEARNIFDATIYGDEMKHYDVELIFQEEINEKNNLEN